MSHVIIIVKWLVIVESFKQSHKPTQLGAVIVLPEHFVDATQDVHQVANEDGKDDYSKQNHDGAGVDDNL